MKLITIDIYFALIAIAFVFLGGVIVGHQFGLIREKRREFNLVAAAIRGELTSSFDSALSQFPTISPEQQKLIFSIMSPFHREVFHKAYIAYLNGIDATGVTLPDGTTNTSDVHLIEKHFRKVIEHLRDK